MKGEVLARRYARALFDLAEERGVVEEAREQLGWVNRLVADQPALREVLLHPLHPEEMKLAVLEQTVAPRVSTLVMGFLRLLVERGREDHLSGITDEFATICDESRGVVQAEVTTAQPLDDRQREELKSALGTATGRSVRLNESLDGDLLAGIHVRIRDLTLDGSLRSRLQRLYSSLRG